MIKLIPTLLDPLIPNTLLLEMNAILQRAGEQLIQAVTGGAWLDMNCTKWLACEALDDAARKHWECLYLGEDLGLFDTHGF